ILRIPTSHNAFFIFANAVHDAMENNVYFPNPNPTLVAFATNIAAFAESETKAASKTKGLAAARNAKRMKVKADLRHLADYVQSVAEAQATPAEAIAVIESAFMSVRKPVTRTKAELEARNDEMPGTVELIAKAVSPKATYFWQYSLDQQAWTSAAETMKASTVVSGLQSAQAYFFRFRSLTPMGPRDYSQVVSLLVH
ncbi:MAG: hypothetical protein ABI193_03805, partial [Minicystis sp.]